MADNERRISYAPVGMDREELEARRAAEVSRRKAVIAAYEKLAGNAAQVEKISVFLEYPRNHQVTAPVVDQFLSKFPGIMGGYGRPLVQKDFSIEITPELKVTVSASAHLTAGDTLEEISMDLPLKDFADIVEIRPGLYEI